MTLHFLLPTNQKQFHICDAIIYSCPCLFTAPGSFNLWCNCWFSLPGLPGKQWLALHLLSKPITKIKMTIMARSRGQKCLKLLFMAKKNEACPQDWK